MGRCVLDMGLVTDGWNNRLAVASVGCASGTHTTHRSSTWYFSDRSVWTQLGFLAQGGWLPLVPAGCALVITAGVLVCILGTGNWGLGTGKSLQANTDLNELENILQWFKQLEHLPIPKTAWVHRQLALAEGFTNAVRHAHKGLPLETPIELEVTVFNERLEIRIWDCRQLFDLEAKLRELKERDQEIPTPMLRNVLESGYS